MEMDARKGRHQLHAIVVVSQPVFDAPWNPRCMDATRSRRPLLSVYFNVGHLHANIHRSSLLTPRLASVGVIKGSHNVYWRHKPIANSQYSVHMQSLVNDDDEKALYIGLLCIPLLLCMSRKIGWLHVSVTLSFSTMAIESLCLTPNMLICFKIGLPVVIGYR